MFHVKPATILAFSVAAVAVAVWYFRKPKDDPKLETIKEETEKEMRLEEIDQEIIKVIEEQLEQVNSGIYRPTNDR